MMVVGIGDICRPHGRNYKCMHHFGGRSLWVLRSKENKAYVRTSCLNESSGEVDYRGVDWI